MIMEPDKDTGKRLFTIKQWPDSHNWPPQGGLRHLIFNEEKNGFSNVIVRVGRRVLIDEQKFYEWVESQKKPGGNGNSVVVEMPTAKK